MAIEIFLKEERTQILVLKQELVVQVHGIVHM